MQGLGISGKLDRGISEGLKYQHGPLAPGLLASTELEPALCDVDLVLFVVPSQYARAVYTAAAPSIDSRLPVVVAAKGIEEGSLALPLEVSSRDLFKEMAVRRRAAA